jgi:hypothetical protein
MYWASDEWNYLILLESLLFSGHLISAGALSNNPLDTKVLFLDEMIRAVDANKIVLVEKRKEADIAVSSLIIEARIVAAVLAVQVLFLVFVQLYGG